MGDPCRIRPAEAPDLAAVTGIERSTFSDPWPRPAFEELLNDWSWVAEIGGAVAGYLCARVAADEAEILNLAVHQQRRRQGIGRRLLDAALNAFRQAGIRAVYLEVRESNAEGQAFYLALGFRQVGRRRSYYQKPREDALVLARGTEPIGKLA